MALLKLLNAVQNLILPFIRSADEVAGTKQAGHGLAIPGGGPRTALVEHHKPERLTKLLNFHIPDGAGQGKDGLLAIIENVLNFSVNTWDQGFLDKLYSSTNAVCRFWFSQCSFTKYLLGRSSFRVGFSCFKHERNYLL